MTEKRFDERIEQEICVRYRGGESSVTLGKVYGASKYCILNVLKRHNVPRRDVSTAAKARRSDKHTIVVPDMANLQPIDKYWLGFLLGDGCIFHPKKASHSSLMSINLQVGDRHHLERLKRYFNSDKKLVDQKENGEVIKVALQIASDDLVSYLEHFNIHQRKSQKEIAHPALKDSKDFWRGMIDADGSIYISENQTCLSLTGSQTICNQFEDYLVANFGIKYDDAAIKERTGCFELVIKGNQKANRVIRHLYINSCMSLTRKLILAMQLNHAKFEFRRLKDISGVSGTGVVADGYVSRNGKVGLFWCASDVGSVVIYDSLEEMFRIHNHEENSYIAWKEFDHDS